MTRLSASPQKPHKSGFPVPTPTKYPRTKRHNATHAGTAAILAISTPTSLYAGHGADSPERRVLSWSGKDLLTSGWSQVRNLLRPPAETHLPGTRPKGRTAAKYSSRATEGPFHSPTGIPLKRCHVFPALAVLADARIDWAGTRGMNEFERKAPLSLTRPASEASSSGGCRPRSAAARCAGSGNSERSRGAYC